LLLTGLLTALTGCSKKDDTGTDTGPPPDDAHEVTIRRDAYGVPHIRSSTDIGAYYGLGWAHAQDRLLQMNIFVWATQGRMAEALGPDWVESDTAQRIIGTWRHAKRVADSLPDEHQALLSAFADGVNASVASYSDEINPLFAELGMTPETWTPAHSIVAWWRVAEFFTNNGLNKAEQYYEFMDLVSSIGMEAAIEETTGDAHPGDPDAAVVQVEDVPAEVQAEIHVYAATMGYGTEATSSFAHLHPKTFNHETPKFSHAWAVAGSNTSTGNAVLISDPQIPVQSPNVMYEWQLEGATFNVRGISAAGSAGPLVAFNEHVAWGMTATGADIRDLFRMEMTRSDTYEVDGEEHTFNTTEETLLVRGGDPVTVAYRESIWGPVVTELTSAREGDEFAVKGAPFSEVGTDTFVAMLAMMRAKTVDDLHLAVEDWRFPSANLIAADSNGDVFYTLLGAIPVRSVSSPLGGLIAQEGTSLTYDHQDTIPAIYKPWVKNPAQGYVYSANHRAEDGWYPLPLGLGSGGNGHTARSRSLSERLDALPIGVTPDEILAEVQYDCVNVARRDIVVVLRHILTTADGPMLSTGTVNALEALVEWSDNGGQMRTGYDGVFLAYRINAKFREVQTGPEVSAEYGGGENGINLFLKTHLAAIAADPDYLVDANSRTYLDNRLSDAWESAINAQPDTTRWTAAYDSSTKVNRTLNWFGNISDLGTDYNSGVVYEAPPIQCADGGTIWSQVAETYTHFVPLNDPDGALSVLGPGNTEGATDDWWTAQGERWASGDLKPAPLSLNAISAIAIEEHTLSYTP
jgi:penicillin amidase